MKKIIIAIIAIIVITVVALMGVGYFLSQKSQQPEKTTSQQETTSVPSEKISFDTNDNLDQAIEDLRSAGFEQNQD